MANVAFQLNDTISAELAALERDLSGDAGVRAVLGRQLVDDLAAHFTDLNRERHRAEDQRGDRVGGFYEGAALAVHDPRQTTTTLADEGVTVSMSYLGLAQRYYGGTLLPTGGRHNLALPARSEALGKSPSDFPQGYLRFVPFASGAKALVLAGDTDRVFAKGRRQGETTAAGSRPGQEATHGAGGVLFWLVASVTQTPDPSVLPEDDVLETNAVAAAAAYLSRPRG